MLDRNALLRRAKVEAKEHSSEHAVMQWWAIVPPNPTQPNHYPGATKRGVEVRGDALPAEYLRKARDTDRDFCGTAPGTQGPVETKLRSFPPLLKLVVGPLGECSGDLHELLNTLAESKMKYLSRSRGELESEWKTASHLTYMRR